jgi:hypothetical protein
MAIMDGYVIWLQYLTWARRTYFEKEMKEEARQRAGRLAINRLKDKVDMAPEKGDTPEAGKWNNTDLKVIIQWFKREGGKAMPKNKYGLLPPYCETCTHVVAAITYRYDDDEAIVTAVIHVAASTVAPAGGVPASAVGVATATADVAPTSVLWSLTRSPATDAAQPPAAADRLSAARAPNLTQGKHTFAAAAAGIPDSAHVSTQDQSAIPSVAAPASGTASTAAITTKTTTTTVAAAAFSIHNHEDGATDEWDLAPLGPRAKGKVAASSDSCHHVAHCGFDLLLSDSESEGDINASEFDDCDDFLGYEDL